MPNFCWCFFSACIRPGSQIDPSQHNERSTFTLHSFHHQSHKSCRWDAQLMPHLQAAAVSKHCLVFGPFQAIGFGVLPFCTVNRQYFIILWRVVLFSFAVGEAWQCPLHKDWSQQPSLKFEEVHSYTNRIPFHSIRTRGMLAAENRNNANSWFQSFPVCFALQFLYTHYKALDGFIRLHCRIVESSNVTWKAWQLD